MADKKKTFFTFVLLGLLTLSACGKADCRLNAEEPDGQLKEENAAIYEMEKESIKDEVWSNKIYVTEEQLQGNILGYSLKRNQVLNMWYEQDMPYLLNEASVGKGVFISEYMCETEVFIGSIIKDILMSHGEVNSEQKQYFSDWALEQLTLVDWDLLNKQWSPDLYTYDRNYELLYVLGKSNYSFSYIFYANEKENMMEELNYVNITCFINSEGKICEIKISINTTAAEDAGMKKTVNDVGLFDDTFNEIVVSDGNIYSGKILLDFEKYFKRLLYTDEKYEQNYNGLLVTGDAALSAESVGKIFIDILEARGENVSQYAEWFAYDTSFYEFKSNIWDYLEDNWTANAEYDCVYIDNVIIGYVGFQYYFYPNYDIMNTDMAKAVIINCNVDIITGKLGYIDIRFFPMTRQEYQTVKDMNGMEHWNTAVIERGQMMLSKEKVNLPVPQNELIFMPIEEFCPRVLLEDNYKRKKKYELWGYSDVSEIADYLGELFLEEIENETIEKGSIIKVLTDKVDVSCLHSIAECTENLIVDEKYDCYYMRENECAGNIHLKYYFYLQGCDGNCGSKTVVVIDLYISELGIEYMQVNDFESKN